MVILNYIANTLTRSAFCSSTMEGEGSLSGVRRGRVGDSLAVEFLSVTKKKLTYNDFFDF